MIKKALFIFTIISSLSIYGQEQKLQGIWILDKVLTSKNEPVEINDEDFYSLEEIFEIIPEMIYINGVRFEANFTKNTIKTNYKEIKYEFDNQYLVTKENNEGHIFYFLKIDLFMKNNPEFKPQQNTKEGSTYVVSNQIIKPIFNNNITFENFITKNIHYNYVDISYQETPYFKINFLLTTENQIKDIEINDLRGINKNDIINILIKSQPYLINPINKNLFVNFEYNLMGENYINPQNFSEQKILDLRNKINDFYTNNKFEKVVLEFSKLNKKEIPNKFKGLLKEVKLKVAISYLALKKTEEACNIFQKLGGKNNLKTRNYMLNFCNK